MVPCCVHRIKLISNPMKNRRKREMVVSGEILKQEKAQTQDSDAHPLQLCHSGSVLSSIILILLQSPLLGRFSPWFQMEMLEYSSCICFLK